MQIIENYLPKPLFETIKVLTMESDFPYLYQSKTADQKDTSNFFFGHKLFWNRQPLSNYLIPIVYPLMAKIEHTELLRAKVNCYPRYNEQIISGFHIDQDEQHKVLLYSVNTNNGYTLFENGDKVPSVANQAVIFDGHLKHSSVNQTDENIRVNININYK